MQIVVEENCKLDGNYKKFIESFVKELIIKFLYKYFRNVCDCK